MRLLQPDRYFARISCIDIARDLRAQGVDSILVDIDNTIRSRETHDVPRDVVVWLEEARACGMGVCLLSNNWHANVLDVAASLDLPLVRKACKPLPFSYGAACRKIGGTRRRTVVIGDQICTDVLGARLAGMRAILVRPLADVDLPHMARMRSFEQALLGSMPLEGNVSALACEQSGEGERTL